MQRFVALAVGMVVLGSDGQLIGAVKAITPSTLLIDRPWRRDLYAPFAAVRALRHRQVVLALSATTVDRMGWPRPPLFLL